jgi:hypothetical protein
MARLVLIGSLIGPKAKLLGQPSRKRSPFDLTALKGRCGHFMSAARPRLPKHKAVKPSLRPARTHTRQANAFMNPLLAHPSAAHRDLIDHTVIALQSHNGSRAAFRNLQIQKL